MNRLLLLTLVTMFGFAQCQEPADTSKTPAPTTPQPATAAAADFTPTEEYPSIPLATVQMLWEKCDYIDVVFYYTNFSMSASTQGDIRNNIRHISEEAPRINPACKAIGRIFFQVDGVNVAEADMHYADGCNFFIFYENGKKTYANYMTDAGIAFYKNIFAQFGK